MSKQTSSESRTDVYAEVTARIITALEEGPERWVKSWTSNRDVWNPRNHLSDRPYRGVNLALLALTCTDGRYALNRWLTFQQARSIGGTVRKGSKGTLVVFWKRLDGRTGKPNDNATDDDSATDEGGKLAGRSALMAKHFYVFNVADVDGIPESVHDVPSDDGLAAQIILRSGARIIPGEPCYRPSDDLVMLPDASAFTRRDEYFATAYHELAHWTARRVGRETNAKRWGDDAYAMEELIAEMTAAMLCGATGQATLMQSASYLEHWLRVLKADKRAIFSVASAAQKAADYLLTRAGLDESGAPDSEQAA